MNERNCHNCKHYARERGHVHFCHWLENKVIPLSLQAMQYEGKVSMSSLTMEQECPTFEEKK